jgi:hypothetical protein
LEDVAGQREWVWLLVLWAIVTAYNLLKPYHIDDTAHLEIARWISAHPLHPMSGLIYWDGVQKPIYELNQPHLYFYLLASWGAMFGYGEPAMPASGMSIVQACALRRSSRRDRQKMVNRHWPLSPAPRPCSSNTAA